MDERSYIIDCDQWDGYVMGWFNICNRLQPDQQIQVIEMPLQHYQVHHKIGTGKYASVYRVKRLEDGALFAMKKILLHAMTPKERTNAFSEVRLLSSIRHPNILALVEVFYDQFIDALCLVLQLAEEGDLSKRIEERRESKEGLSEDQIWGIVGQVSKGLQFLHSHNIIHRDIKASNILLFGGGVVKIGDLNISKINDGLFYTRTGTFGYASPQIWKGERYDSKTDMWSFGCLIYEMICLRRPFQGEEVQEIYKKIVKCSYAKICNEAYSRELKDLVTFMIQLNPKLRPSATTMVKVCKNKLTKLHHERYERAVSFHLSSVVIPGLQASQFAEERCWLDTSSSVESNLYKKQVRSKHLSPIPTTLKAIKKLPQVLQIGNKHAKSRYYKYINHLPAFSNETPSHNLSKDIPEVRLNESGVFKRSVKANKLKIVRRKTQA